MRITFLGAGAYGTALSDIAKYNGHETKFYDPIKFPDITLDHAISGADVVVYVAPSGKAGEILPQLDTKTPLICASKGFLSTKPFTNFSDFSVLAGAGYADDIKKSIDNPAAEQIRLTGTSDLITKIFSTENIIIEHTTDVIGVLLCGSLKNIYAIGAGYYGATSDYLKNALAEMAQILDANGASQDTVRLSCGAADLLLTCTDESRNYNYGKSLRQATAQDPHQSATAQDPTLTEGVSAITHLVNYPEFTVPPSAKIFNDIVKLVQSNANQSEDVQSNVEQSKTKQPN